MTNWRSPVPDYYESWRDSFHRIFLVLINICWFSFRKKNTTIKASSCPAWIFGPPGDTSEQGFHLGTEHIVASIACYHPPEHTQVGVKTCSVMLAVLMFTRLRRRRLWWTRPNGSHITGDVTFYFPSFWFILAFNFIQTAEIYMYKTKQNKTK